MGRIDAAFTRLKERREKALIPYVMAGDPSLEATRAMVLEIERAGGDLIELGVPFSDPIADGPVIQCAAQRALAQGISLKKVISLVEALRSFSQIPLLLMCYYNTIWAMGESEFFHRASLAGVDGVIIPDLPLEESQSLRKIAKKFDVDLVFLLAPLSPPHRIEKISRASQGFIYYVSLTGVTGARLAEFDHVHEKVEAIRRVSRLPVAVGFGISSPREAAQVAAVADGVIVGSALVRLIAECSDHPDLLKRVGRTVRQLKHAICRS